MRKRYGSAALVGAFTLLLAASLYAQNTYTFKDNIQPVLNNNWLWCHSFMSSYENLLAHTTTYNPAGLLAVYPGRPDSSVIVWRQRGQLPSGGSIARMPQFADPLSEETIQMFIDWIAAGAPDESPVSVEQKTWGGVKADYR